MKILLDLHRYLAGETISLQLLECDRELDGLYFLLSNNYCSFPETGDDWLLSRCVQTEDGISRGPMRLRLRIDDQPLHNPDGGSYQLQLRDKNHCILASESLYIAHWQSLETYGELLLLPQPKTIFHEGQAIRLDADLPWQIKNSNPDLQRTLSGFVSQVLGQNCHDCISEVTCLTIQTELYGRAEYKSTALDRLFDKSEAYQLEITEEAGVVLRAIDRLALQQALKTLMQLLKSGVKNDLLPLLEIQDWPDFPRRGIVEGFYGKPWSPEARKKLLRHLSLCKHNVYFYAPKDDVYHREKWREDYEEQDWLALKDLVDYCEVLGISFVYSVSPGLSIRYTSNEDRALLLKKYQSLQDIGVRDFALLFDDIDEQLHWPEDIKQFDNHLAYAQAGLSNWLFGCLNAKAGPVEFVICPTEYHQQGDSDYRRGLREKLNPSIDCLWSGNGIFSPRISLEDGFVHKQVFGRPLWLWDNFPVNDADKSSLVLDGLSGRDPELHQSLSSLLSNPMPEALLSAIPLGTCADFTWNGAAYETGQSRHMALRLFIKRFCDSGPTAEVHWLRLVEACSGSRITAGIGSDFLRRMQVYMTRADADSITNLLAEIVLDLATIRYLKNDSSDDVLEELKVFLGAWENQLLALSRQLEPGLVTGLTPAVHHKQLYLDGANPYDGRLLAMLKKTI